MRTLREKPRHPPIPSDMSRQQAPTSAGAGPAAVSTRPAVMSRNAIAQPDQRSPLPTTPADAVIRPARLGPGVRSGRLVCDP